MPPPQPPAPSPSCGFHGADGAFATLAQVRAAIVQAALGERKLWFNTTTAMLEVENTDARFGDLVSYWLAGQSGHIHPGKLQALQNDALQAAYGHLANSTLNNAITDFAAREAAVNASIADVYSKADAVDAAAPDASTAKTAFKPANDAKMAAERALAVAKAARPKLAATVAQAEAALTQAKSDLAAARRVWSDAQTRLTSKQNGERKARAAVVAAKAKRKLAAGPAQAWDVADRTKHRKALIAAGAHPDPQLVNSNIDDALQLAHQSRADIEPWSAVFVGACVRAAAIQLKLEAMNSADKHVGKNAGKTGLLAVSRRHSDYVVEARTRQEKGTKATYHAFNPDAWAVQPGDIIVTERTDFIQDPEALKDLKSGAYLHGDIVTELGTDSSGVRYAETIGGNVGHSVRRRRYPLDAADKLVLAKDKLVAQEDAQGQFAPFATWPNIPRLLRPMSAGRIMAHLSLVETCAPPPVGLTPKKKETRQPEQYVDLESPFVDEEILSETPPADRRQGLIESPFASDLDLV